MSDEEAECTTIAPFASLIRGLQTAGMKRLADVINETLFRLPNPQQVFRSDAQLVEGIGRSRCLCIRVGLLDSKSRWSAREELPYTMPQRTDIGRQ